MKKIVLCVCLIAILVLSAVVPVSACWPPPAPFEVVSGDGNRVFVFDPTQYDMGNANAAVYEIVNSERQLLYTVEDLATFAYRENFHFTADLTHFIRTFPNPGMSYAFEVFSYGVRTRVVLRSDFIEDYTAARMGVTSVCPPYAVGWQIIDRSLDGDTFTIYTGESSTFVFDIRASEFIGDNLPSRVQISSNGTPSSWAYDSVERAGELGLLPDTFRSGFRRSTTRAEFATIATALYEHFREPVTGRVTFTDTTDTNVEKAAYLGIVTGVGNNRFDPNSPITREQAAVMLNRLVGLFGFHSHNVFPQFDDHQEISAWAMLAVGHIQARGIMSGIGGNRFAPQDLYTIEQSIVTIFRVFDLVYEGHAISTTERIETMNYVVFLELLEINGFVFESVIGVPTRGRMTVYIGGESLVVQCVTTPFDGTIPLEVEITWTPEFHWPTRGSMSVIYSGNDDRIIDLLNAIFGYNPARQGR